MFGKSVDQMRQNVLSATIELEGTFCSSVSSLNCRYTSFCVSQLGRCICYGAFCLLQGENTWSSKLLHSQLLLKASLLLCFHAPHSLALQKPIYSLEQVIAM